MKNFKLTKTGGPNKWLYKVIDEAGVCLAKRSSSRDYVAAVVYHNKNTLTGSIVHGVGREDLVLAALSKYDFTPGQKEAMINGESYTPDGSVVTWAVAYLKAEEATDTNVEETRRDLAPEKTVGDYFLEIGKKDEQIRRLTEQLDNQIKNSGKKDEIILQLQTEIEGLKFINDLSTSPANEPAEIASTLENLKAAERLGEITDDARRFTALQEILLNVGLFGSSETWGAKISLQILRVAIRNFNLPQTPIDSELEPDLSESMVTSAALSEEVIEAERLYNLYLLSCGNKRLSSDLILSKKGFIEAVIDGPPLVAAGLWFQLYKEPTEASPFKVFNPLPQDLDKQIQEAIDKRRQILLEDLRHLSTNGELHELID